MRCISSPSLRPVARPHYRRPTISRAMNGPLQTSVIGVGWTLVSMLLLLRLQHLDGIEANIPIEKECRLDFFRLPRRIEPTNYKLFIKPNLRDFTYRAELIIQLLVNQEPQDSLCPKNQVSASATTEPSRDHPKSKQKTKRKKLRVGDKSPPLFCDRSKIVLHAHRDLNISRLDFAISEGNQIVQVRNFCRDFKNELLVVGLNVELDYESSAKLRIHFDGPIRDDMHGLFRSEYQTQEKPRQTRHMAITHFQAPHARKAFPCFDEPNFKSNFNLIIEHPTHLKALSNTRVVKEETVRYRRRRRRRRQNTELDKESEVATQGNEESGNEEEFTRVHFAQTPRMSTYLLAFAVGEFDHIETQVGKLKLAIWTAPGRAHLARYALKNAALAYGALRDYFLIEQPVDKIDFVAVRELDAGAMENWGLITFTEHFLLLDENNTTPDDINYATDSITHELSHQWFGNLVTMKWWDDLWLNEGFATWITQVINQQLYPDRDGEIIYLIDALNAALNSDASRKTHPIRNKQLQTVKEIESSFDDITYEKASAVIRMLNDYLGPAQFKLGIRNYLEANLYENTEALDLWNSLESTTQLNVRDLMGSWIDQPGFPLLRTRLTQDGRTLRIDQERFLERIVVDPSLNSSTTLEVQATQAELTGANSIGRQKWIIPLALWISNGRERTKLFKVIISERGANIKLPIWFDVRHQGHWLKLNAKFGGFYRVSYDDLRLFKALRLPIEHKLMSPSDRLNVICDMFALLANEKLDMMQFDEALSWFRGEDNDAVLDVLARYIASLEAHQYPTNGWDRTRLLVDYYLREGKFEPRESNSWLKLRTRANVASSLIVIQNQGVARDAIEVFQREASGGDKVPLSFRVPIFSAVARAGSTEQVTKLINHIQKLELSQSQSRLVDAMSESITAGHNQASKKESRI